MTTTQPLLHHTNKHYNDSNHLKCKYPMGLMPLPTQIAGHGSQGDGHRAILKREDGKILKPIQPPPKGPRETNFYVNIKRSLHPVDIAIRSHIPNFFGVEQIGFTNGVTITEDFLVLADITEGFKLPSVMDVKVGTQTWGPDATEAKIAQESAKYVGTKGPFGFSILGMIVHALDSENPVQVVKYDKSFGKNLKTSEVNLVPEIFLNFEQSPPKEFVQIIVDKIKAIRDVFEIQRRYKIYASSLLLAYDSDAVRKYKQGFLKKEDLQKFVNIKLIDFAHVFSADGERDDNFLRGLNNLLDLFTQFLQRVSK